MALKAAHNTRYQHEPKIQKPSLRTMYTKPGRHAINRMADRFYEAGALTYKQLKPYRAAC